MQLRSLALLTAALVAIAGCKDDPETTPDAGNVGTPDGGSEGDGGPVDAGDGKCHGDEACPTNQYCELGSGLCIDAKRCSSNEECDYQEVGSGDYCEFGGCWCDTERGGGTCRPRVRLCKPCSSDAECGSDPFIYLDYVATCRDFDGTKVCLPQRLGSCPPAYIPASDGTHCEPAGGKCDGIPACARDTDCDAFSERPVCDTSRGICVASCIFEFQTGRSDCPPNQVCHVDPRLLQESNPNFGGGKCAVSCDAATDPFTCGAGTACEADGDPVLVTTRPTRCRPPAPKCVRDADCPADQDHNSRGYCDRNTLNCAVGCRRESDCNEGFKCSQGECVEKTCVESGGALLDCGINQFCCGEALSPECPAGVSYGQCYDAPNPPWCGECTTADTTVQTPASGRPAESRCIEIEEASGAKKNWQIHSCDPTKPAQCPRGWACRAPPPCKVDADCGTGGKCGRVQAPWGEGAAYNACVCNSGESCPSGSTCQKDQDGNPSVCAGGWCELADCFPEPQ